MSILGLSIAISRNPMMFSSGDIIIREPGKSNIKADNTNPYAGEVVCEVVGCVKQPGVYHLPAGTSVKKAISVAGGPKENADLQYINLAAKIIEDGSRIYVPSFKQTHIDVEWYNTRSQPSDKAKNSEFTSRSDSGSSSDKPSVPEEVVNINSAGMAELQRLPGVGPVTAEKILEYRKQIGRFKQPEQLMDVKGIGPKKFEQMRPFVAL
jgi:competence protein ComEA